MVQRLARCAQTWEARKQEQNDHLPRNVSAEEILDQDGSYTEALIFDSFAIGLHFRFRIAQLLRFPVRSSILSAEAVGQHYLPTTVNARYFERLGSFADIDTDGLWLLSAINIRDKITAWSSLDSLPRQ